MSANRVLLGDNLERMRDEPAESVQMAYLDPPFNTGSDRTRRTLSTTASVNGDRIGFGGRRYATKLLEESSYRDAFDDYLGFLEPRLSEVRRLLHPTAPSTSTSTGVRRTTASCCSTSCSVARASSTS